MEKLFRISFTVLVFQIALMLVLAIIDPVGAVRGWACYWKPMFPIERVLCSDGKGK